MQTHIAKKSTDRMEFLEKKKTSPKKSRKEKTEE